MNSWQFNSEFQYKKFQFSITIERITLKQHLLLWILTAKTLRLKHVDRTTFTFVFHSPNGETHHEAQMEF